MMKYKIADRCKVTKIHDVSVIGCPECGAMYGLTSDGMKLIMNINEGKDLEIDKLNCEQKMLFFELESEHFFDENWKLTSKMAYFHVTNQCNMNCVGCYSKNDHRNESEGLTTEQCIEVIDNMDRADVKRIIISGGEPTLRSDLIDILEYINKKGIKSSVITNGTASLEIYKSILELTDNLAFSFDGVVKEHSIIRREVFEKEFGTVETLRKTYNNISFIFTIHHKNMRYRKEMEEYARKVGVMYNYSAFTSNDKDVSEYKLDEQDYKDIFNEHMPEFVSDSGINTALGFRNGCGAGKKIISVSSNGDIYPCHMFYGMDYKMGNALKDEIAVVTLKYDGPYPAAKREKCSKCEYVNMCAGGCEYQGYLADLKNENYLCELYSNYYRKAFNNLLEKIKEGI